MSSACDCHLGGFCFYCEMYVPLERERDMLAEKLEKVKEVVSTERAAHWKVYKVKSVLEGRA